ncbi:MAG: CHAT domain-containing protein [Anaerolineae bacterium]
MAAQWDPVSLRQAMTDRMSTDEVEALCFDLGIDVDNLGGDTKSAKIRELIQYMQRRGRLDDLTAQLAKQRPDIQPPGGSPQQASPQATPSPATNPSSTETGQAQAPASTPVAPTGSAPSWTYVDFDVAVTQASSGYTVNVIASPAGQASATTQIALADGPIADGVAALKRAQFDSALAKSLGGTLLSTLLKGDVANAYFATLGRAESQQSGVRLRLRITAPELKSLPWEYLYDAQRDNFLAVRRDVVISRYLEVFQGIGASSPPAALRILVLLSGPAGPAVLDLAGEQKRIEDALAPLVTAGRVVVEFETNPTAFNIRARLRRNVYHVIHYSGHAYYATESKLVLNQSVTQDTGYVVLPNDDGTARLLDEASFAQFFVGNPSIRLIILNACQGAQSSLTEYLSGLGDKLVQTAGLPAVVAMQFPIADMAAKQFAQEFYASLTDGLPIDAAVAQARLALFQDRGASDRAWGTPVLFMRSADGRLFA